MAQIRYAVEPWGAALPEMMGLWPAHWAEIAADKDKISFDPDLERYAEMEGAGVLHVITARKSGELVGYSIWMVGPHLHHRSTLFGVSDAYWLRPDCRKGLAGVRLIKESERHLKSLGVKKLISTAQPSLGLESLYQRLGWGPGENVYCKYVGTNDE